MPKRISRPKRPGDLNQLAYQLVRESTEKEADIPKTEISRVMAAMGRKGGKIGGKRRAERMTPEQRRKSAAKAARARWARISGKEKS